MSYQLIHQALAQSLVDLGLSLQIAPENVDFNTDGLDSFIAVNMLPAGLEVITKNSLDIERGIYQISIYTKLGTGVADANTIADTIFNFYRHGVELVNSTQIVFIDRTERNIRKTDGWYIVDCSIYYSADLLR